MRILTQILFLSFILISISACDKNENDPKETLKATTISAKWNVNNSNEYKSFEFNNSGSYIIVKKKSSTKKSANDQTILFGTYEIMEDKKVVLSDFGTLIFSDVKENSVSFSIQPLSNPNNEIIMSASKQEEMEATTKTELLCRTWKMVSVNGEEVVGTRYELSVLFSKAGTYFVEPVNFGDDENGGLSNWKWSDSSETKFLYSWNTPPVWDEKVAVEVIELTNNSLKILERFEGEEDEFYELVPSNNTKSAKIELNKALNKQIRSGFLKK
ncbi:hypothetical protein [Tenacibaculum maritimum]|uniref:hypothetical protein n=1 Tax=Tenacibaculum maritimum TaxID=107401 RepID=UPI0012E593CD|nr:hypothetical protein [Tenacibaculum maritimum]CAA0161374.1 Probable lipoprotein precursor [Tenacibaculum maritimum]CAA0240192.1 Probable lipoprotein precursor [Tenacibaculum maritimum]